jgi:hypothetical protein
MKINQLFTRLVCEDLTLRLLSCFSLAGFIDKHMFSNQDLVNNNTVEKLNSIVSELRLYYMPCKARIYLSAIDENA